MDPRKIKRLLHDDVMYLILQWLPVASLLRYKHVCRSWRALIESSYFIKMHLHLHHYDPSLKDKNQNLICLLPGKDSSITFALTSIESFEESNVCLQLNYSDLHGSFPIKVVEIVSYNGIICLNLFNLKRGQSICLWNPATKQSRVLSLPFPNMARSTVGFGFDVKSNDYKVVNLIRCCFPDEKRVEVYSFNTRSWRSVTTVFPFIAFLGNPRMPFNNGTCFFWLLGYNSVEDKGIFCFDFSSEMFRSISFPSADGLPLFNHTSVVHDKIACLRQIYGQIYGRQIEIWVLNEYGRVNESWAKLYTVDLHSKIDGGIRIEYLSTNGIYIFFKRKEQMCRFNVAIEEETNISTLEKVEEFYKNCPTQNQNMYYWFDEEGLVEFKESLVSVGEGINAPAGVNKDTGKKKQETITN